MVKDRYVGESLRRREDAKLLRGEASYTANRQPADGLHAVIVRSHYAHAAIDAIETTAAERIDGVVGVDTWADLVDSGVPGTFRVDGALAAMNGTTYRVLARDTVRYTGEPLALVVAHDPYTARDGAAAIEVQYDRKPVVTSVADALAPDAPTLHADHPDNCALDWAFGDRDATNAAFDEAEHVFELTMGNQRVIPNPMEPRTVHATYDPDHAGIEVTASTQAPHGTRADIAHALGLNESAVRVISPDVGGGFGVKGSAPYAARPLVAWAAMQHEQPVSWQATRSETHLADRHGRGMTITGEIAVSAENHIQALRYDAEIDIGAYLLWNNTPAPNFRELASGAYDIPSIYGAVRGAFTNKTPIGPYRGAGRPESIYAVEALVGHAARQLGVDPVAFRKANFIPEDQFPFETAVGTVYDSGAYAAAMDKALDRAEYDALREEQTTHGANDRYRGVGIAAFVENTGTGPGRSETARITIAPDGRVTAYCGTHDHGQGHRTTFSQLLADTLGVPYDAITIVEGDTDDLPSGTGTFGSRSAPVGGSVLAQTADEIIEDARHAAAGHLEAPVEDVTFDEGEFRVRGAPDRAVSLQTLAHTTTETDEGVVFDATTTYDPETNVYAFGTHIAAVDIDPATGEVSIDTYVAVDDYGHLLNPMIVEGQVHGGIAQGLGQALLEHAHYDANGNLLAGSFMDYAMPRAMHIPDIETDHTTTPTPWNPLGVKGAGESGTIAAPPAITNAVLDALQPLGVEWLDMPFTGERVWRALTNAKEARKD